MVAFHEDSLARSLESAGVKPLSRSSALSKSSTPTSAKIAPSRWQLENLRGRLIEVSGGPRGAALTWSFRLVLESQRLGEPVVWITGPRSTFFPPDIVENGIDLAALVVIQVPDARAAWRSADLLVRSGGFGVVALDLGAMDKKANLPLAVQSRLAGLAKKHRAALLFLTERTARDVTAQQSSSPHPSSLGPLISLHVETERALKIGDRYACELHVLKDKHGHRSPVHPSWQEQELCRVPDGLC